MKYWRNFFLTFGIVLLLAYVVSIWLRIPFRWWVFVGGAVGVLIADYGFGKRRKKHKGSVD
ncbi:hypothetical protein FEZ34_09955 [Lacticaseibacillus casei]|nr:hypothetical protein FEZ34_09955 [Lacticaseibacillus casei]